MKRVLLLLFVVVAGVAAEGLFLDPREVEDVPDAIPINGERDPIILVPGLSGTQLDAKLDKTESKHWWCSKHSDWYNIWVAINQILPEVADCFVENIELVMDNHTGVFSPPEGVTTRAGHGKPYGDLEPVLCLDKSLCSKTGAYLQMATYFENVAGYKPGVDLFGAGYDWRNVMPQFTTGEGLLDGGAFAELKQLMEDVLASTGKKSHLLSISNGGTYVAYFLDHYVDQEWKDQHVASFLSMSGVFSGSPWAIYSLITPFQWRLPSFVSGTMIRHIVRTFGSMMWLAPPSFDPWWKSRVLVSTPERNYTVMEYADLFGSMGQVNANVTLEIFQHMDKDWVLNAPGVPLHVMYGAHCPTNITYEYSQWPPGPDDQPSGSVSVDGDGTVEMHSLVEVPQQWATDQTQPVTFAPFEGVQHADLLFSQAVFDHILNITVH